MKYVFRIDTERCVACGACEVACMDLHDTDLGAGEVPFRVVGEEAARLLQMQEGQPYISVACMHCEDAPCIAACPMGCISKNELGLTVYDPGNCIGCRACLRACPYGAPKFYPDGKMHKCDGCTDRLQAGLQPACVSICPTKALTCGKH